MTNMEALKTRKRQLCGASVSVPVFNSRDQLALLMRLALAGKAPTPENILVARMEVALEVIPEPYKPFAEAVLQLYLHKVENKMHFSCTR